MKSVEAGVELRELISGHPRTCRQLQRTFGGCVWDPKEFRREFDLLEISNPICLVRRKRDGVRRVIWYQNRPRLYFSMR